MSDREIICLKCRAPANVHIRDVDNSAVLVRHLCMNCADEADALLAGRDSVLDHCAISISVGLFVLVLSVFADGLGFGNTAVFGWKQILGIGVAGVLILAGAVMRVPTMLIVGLIFGVLALLADWLGFGNSEGFGRHQITGTFAGFVFIVAGLIGSYKKR